jgi:Arc/MetJ-type ribon-helix-helix transcriptional regulator
MAVKKESVAINVKIPVTLRDLINEAIERDCHTNLSDFTRDALRQKIERDCPRLYKELFEKSKEQKP